MPHTKEPPHPIGRRTTNAQGSTKVNPKSVGDVKRGGIDGVLTGLPSSGAKATNGPMGAKSKRSPMQTADTKRGRSGSLTGQSG